jgi:D-alanyl-D-alanine-carboxypeptidase/D-alanyl-D-alanine-endopeptidase
MTRSTAAVLTVIALGVSAAAQAPATQQKPSTAAGSPAIQSDQDIRDILIKRIDTDKQGVGIVVGLIEPNGRRIVSYGRLAAGDARPLDGDTVFEIGSISKVFTALLLADMARRNEVALTDPIAKYLPEGTKVPERNGRLITLEDLATHTSGLPRMPSNFAPKDPANPYADYGLDRLTQFLASYTLTRDPGAQYEYSNLGGGLLGTLLARRAGMNYEALLESRVTGPLGMKSTRLVLSPDMKARMATGHNGQLTATGNWDFPPDTSALGGAGGIRSTVNDMLLFLAANMNAVAASKDAASKDIANKDGTNKDGTKPPASATPAKPSAGATAALMAAMASLPAKRLPAGHPGMEMALGWHVVKTPDGREIVWHNGGTGGFRAYMGFEPATGRGVVALSNTSTPRGVDDIGFQLIANR